MIKRFLTGFFSVFRGSKYLFQNDLIGYLILPAFFSFLTGLFLAVGIFILLSNFLEGLYSEYIEMPVLEGVLGVITIILSVLVAAALFGLLYRFISSVTVLPFLGPLHDKLEMKLTGSKTETTLKEDLKNTLIASLQAFWQTLLGLLILILASFTGPFQILIVGAVDGYFLGQGTYEAIWERRARTYRERAIYRKKYRGYMWGTGVAFFVLLMVPVVGVILAPAAAMTGASLCYYPYEVKELTDT